jgi:hypothetical protein
LERFVAGEPIAANRDSTWFLICKMVHRHRLATAAALGVFVLACISALWLSVLYQAEARARESRTLHATRNAVQDFQQSV